MKDDKDVMAGLLQVALQELMELERDEHVGVKPHERGEERKTSRNGYKSRGLKTRVGALDLRVPQTRDGEFRPSVLESYQRSEGALVASLAEAYVLGVSTRRMAKLTEELLGTGISASTVSRYAATLDAKLEPWRNRPIECEIPYLIVDARYEKCRRDGRIVDLAVLVAIGVDSEGRRQVLGVETAWGESEASWSSFLGGLVERGLRGVKLVVSDAHAGLAKARAKHLTGVPWQRCQRHFLMNVLEKAPKRRRDELHEMLRRIWDESKDFEVARERMQALAASLEEDLPDVAALISEHGEETLAVMSAAPAEHRKRLRTSNGIERLNQELKRRTKVARIFPNRASCLRLSSAVLIEIDEDWITGRIYLDMEQLAAHEAREENEVSAAHGPRKESDGVN